jgi:hypothetical protein
MSDFVVHFAKKDFFFANITRTVAFLSAEER